MSTSITGKATDELALSASSTKTVAVSGTSVRTIRRSMWENRTAFSSMEFKNNVYGPELTTFEDFPIESGVVFRTQVATRIVGIRIYKHPSAAGSVPVSLWDMAGNLLARSTVTWVADGGGWRTVNFNTPVNIAAEVRHVASYWSPTGHVAYNPWVYNGYNYIEWPFVVQSVNEAMVAERGSRRGWSNGYPTESWHGNFWVDPIAEWEVDTPGPSHGLEWFNQFPNGIPTHQDKFMLGVYYPDPEWCVDYANLGLTMGVGVPIDWPPYRDPVIESGLDIYAYTWVNESFANDPELAERIKGYTVWDEPDMVHNPGTPAQVMDGVRSIRRHDSTRPVDLNLGMWAPQSISYQWWPIDASAEQMNENWRAYAQTADIISCDWYALNGRSPAINAQYGPWVYQKQVHKIMQISDGRLPVWAYIETCPIVGSSRPTPELVTQASWVSIIAGATGIVYFDHQFADVDIPTQHMAWGLNTEPMKSGWQALNAEIHSWAPVLYSPKVDLITGIGSSNTTAGPLGGVYGVPLHHTDRTVGASNYAFVQTLRPGATTATITAPSARYQQVEVVGEGRTVTADALGRFVDSFTTDYQHRVYRWSTTITPGPEGVVITSDNLGALNVGEAMSVTLQATGATPITWSVSAGSLPAGLTLSSAGVVSGTPTTEGAYTVTIRATNAANSDTVVLSGSVIVPPTPIEPTTVYEFDYPNRAALMADGWSFNRTASDWGQVTTEVTTGDGALTYNSSGTLRSPTATGGIYGASANPSNLLTLQVGPEFRGATMHVSGQWSAVYSTCSLLLYGNDDRYWGATRGCGPSGGQVYAISEWNGAPVESTITATEVSDLHLRITRTAGDALECSWSPNGTAWTTLDTLTIPEGTFEYTQLAILNATGPADFVDYIRIHEVSVTRDV